jgi:CBS domain-containing protein
MRIAEVLRRKGSDVNTIRPQASVRELLAELAEHNVGALLVIDPATPQQIMGIVSERDIVRRMHERGADLLDRPVADIMTAAVVTCAPTDTVDHLTVLMTARRVRHVPVLEDGRLVGIASIGDVVKSKIDDLEQTRQQLENYITQGLS